MSLLAGLFGQECCDVLSFRHIKGLTDGALALVDCADGLLGHYADFLGGEVGLEEAAQLDFLFIQDVSESFNK